MGLPYLDKRGPNRVPFVLEFLLLFTGTGFGVANGVAGTSAFSSTLNLDGVAIVGLVASSFSGDSVPSLTELSLSSNAYLLLTVSSKLFCLDSA
jgi:hypothetical protein